MNTNLRTERTLRRQDLVHPELSYKIVGMLFDVYDKLGYGLKEKIYENALALAFKNAGLSFEEQLYSPLIYAETNVGKNYFDFLVEGRVVVELKRGDRIVKAHIEQVYQYLRSKKLELGILAYFSTNGIRYKRILNIPS